MLQGLGNLLSGNQTGLYGTQTQSPLNLLGGVQNSNPLLGGLSNPLGGLSSPVGGLGGLSSPLGGLGGLSNPLGGGLSNPLGGGLTNTLGGLGALGGLGGGSNPLSGLLSGGLKSTQNEQRLMQEKQQRNLLKSILTQQTGDPIKASLISNTIPGRGAGDDFDIGLGKRSDILRTLGLGNQANLSTVSRNPGLLSSLISNNNSLTGSNAGGLLSSLVNLANTSNNNSNILSSLGGLGTGLLGNAGNTGSGLLGSIQSGVNTLNTLNKVSNAVNSVKGLLA